MYDQKVPSLPVAMSFLALYITTWNRSGREGPWLLDAALRVAWFTFKTSLETQPKCAEKWDWFEPQVQASVKN